MEQLDLFSWRPGRHSAAIVTGAHEWKIVSIRETTPDTMPLCDIPQQAVDYWRAHIATAPHFNPDVECLAVLLLNVKMRVRGHHLVSIGSLNETVAQPREVFRAAVIAAAYAVIVMHNHPSGDPTPSDADRRTTKVFEDAGRILRIKLTDHIVVGHEKYCSFRELGLVDSH